MIARPAIALGSFLLAGVVSFGPAHAADVIKIGDLNSYKAMAANMEPYRKGLDLAVAEINAAGGLLGKKLQIVSRDDGANPGEAVRMADELRLNEKVDVLTGTILSHVGVAVGDYARQHKTFFLASAPLTDKIIWEDGNRYTFRLRATTYSHAAAVVPHAAALKRKRWALVYPNYEYGQSAVATFKALLKKAQPDVEFVAELAPPLGKIDSGAVTQALADAKPDAIFNVLFGADLAKFVREGSTRGLFEKTEVVSLLTGEPEYLDPLKDEAPANWYVTGYPWYAIKTPEHMAFLNAYQKRYNDYPRMASLVGYTTIKALAAGITKAGSTDSEKLVAAFEGLKFSSPSGELTFRALDHQATLGLYVGPLGLKNGKGVMTSYEYLDGAKLLPSDEAVRKQRTASSN
ncbi:MAG: ABC transporter substrate-binding protein [Pseudolabrys sp.]|jgi:branched-chain amino acid transport system substrate-binding protein